MKEQMHTKGRERGGGRGEEGGKESKTERGRKERKKDKAASQADPAQPWTQEGSARRGLGATHSQLKIGTERVEGSNKAPEPFHAGTTGRCF